MKQEDLEKVITFLKNIQTRPKMYSIKNQLEFVEGYLFALYDYKIISVTLKDISKFYVKEKHNMETTNVSIHYYLERDYPNMSDGQLFQIYMDWCLKFFNQLLANQKELTFNQD